jgi:hypothetical protein
MKIVAGGKDTVGDMHRVVQSIPASYTIWLDGATYRAESNIDGGTDYSGTNPTTVVQQAINIGGDVAFRGTITFPSVLTLHNNLILSGEGIGATTLKLANSANCILIDEPTARSNITFRNLTFDFNGLNQTDGANREDRCGIRLHDMTNLRFENVQLKNTRSGAATILRRCQPVFLNSCHYLDNEAAGSIHICDHSYMEECVNVNIANGVYDDCTDVGTAFDNCQGVSIAATHYKDCYCGGFTWWNRDDDMIYPHGLTVEGSYIDALNAEKCFYTGHAGTETLRPEDVDIIGCHMKGGTVMTGDFSDLVKGKIIGGSMKSGTSLALNVHNVDGLVLDGVEISDVTTGIDFSAATIQFVRINRCNFRTVTTILDHISNVSNMTLDGTARTVDTVDLSVGSAVTHTVFHTEEPCFLARATLLYTEASSADAGITLEIGKESDSDYYYTGTTETNKALWYSKNLTLLKNDITAGDTVTLYNPGGKTGTGNVMLILDYLTGA